MRMCQAAGRPHYLVCVIVDNTEILRHGHLQPFMAIHLPAMVSSLLPSGLLKPGSAYCGGDGADDGTCRGLNLEKRGESLGDGLRYGWGQALSW